MYPPHVLELRRTKSQKHPYIR